jgi:hypothetical protein
LTASGLDKRLGDYRIRYSALVEKLERNLLSFWGTKLPNFVEHGSGHCSRIVEILSCLLSSEAKTEMSSLEFFILLCGIWLHDVGNFILHNRTLQKDIPDEQRKNHHLLSREFLIQNFPILGLDRYESEATGHLVLAHRKINLAEVPESMIIGTKKVRVRFLAALLRLSDELDTDYRRAPELAEKWLGIPDESADFWTTCQCISGVEVDHYSHLIRIFAKCSDETERNLVEEKLVKIYQELISCSRSLAENKIPVIGIDLIINDQKPITIEELLYQRMSKLAGQLATTTRLAGLKHPNDLDNSLEEYLIEHGIEAFDIETLHHTSEMEGQAQATQFTAVFNIHWKKERKLHSILVRYFKEFVNNTFFELFLTDPSILAAETNSKLGKVLSDFASEKLGIRSSADQVTATDESNR